MNLFRAINVLRNKEKKFNIKFSNESIKLETISRIGFYVILTNILKK